MKGTSEIVRVSAQSYARLGCHNDSLATAEDTPAVEWLLMGGQYSVSGHFVSYATTGGSQGWL